MAGQRNRTARLLPAREQPTGFLRAQAADGVDLDEIQDTLTEIGEYAGPVGQLLVAGVRSDSQALAAYGETLNQRVDWFSQLRDQVIGPYPAIGSQAEEWDRQGEINYYHVTPERTALGEADANSSLARFYSIYSQSLFGQDEADRLGQPLFQQQGWGQLQIALAFSQLLPDIQNASGIEDIIDSPIPSEWFKIHYNRPRPGSAFVDRDAGNFDWSPDYPESGGKSYVSGHTFGGYLFALPLTWIFPERGEELLSRAIQYGESRVVVGAHFPSDTIASRAMMYYYNAQMLENPQLRQFILHNAASVRSNLNEQADGQLSQILGNAVNPVADAYRAEGDEIGYYGQKAADAEPGIDPQKLPQTAANLLLERYPYLSDEQRLDVLGGTAYPQDSLAGFMVQEDNPDSYWGLLDLPNAYRGPARIDQDLNVDQVVSENDLPGYGQIDTWSNDISGDGHLIKSGSGQLTLTGDNDFAGIELDQGTLVLTGDNQFDDTLYVNGGNLVVDGGIDTPVVLQGGTLSGDGSLQDLTINGGSNQFEGSIANEASPSAAARLVADAAAVADRPTIAPASTSASDPSLLASWLTVGTLA